MKKNPLRAPEGTEGAGAAPPAGSPSPAAPGVAAPSPAVPAAPPPPPRTAADVYGALPEADRALLEGHYQASVKAAEDAAAALAARYATAPPPPVAPPVRPYEPPYAPPPQAPAFDTAAAAAAGLWQPPTAEQITQDPAGAAAYVAQHAATSARELAALRSQQAAFQATASERILAIDRRSHADAVAGGTDFPDVDVDDLTTFGRQRLVETGREASREDYVREAARIQLKVQRAAARQTSAVVEHAKAALAASRSAPVPGGGAAGGAGLDLDKMSEEDLIAGAIDIGMGGGVGRA